MGGEEQDRPPRRRGLDPAVLGANAPPGSHCLHPRKPVDGAREGW